MFWTNAFIYILLFIFVVDCALMCLVILMQRSKQEGLGAAFGGGFTDSVWGAQTSNVLVKATVVMAAIFFITSISLARLYTHRASVLEKGSAVQQELEKSDTPPAPAAPATAPTTLPAPPAPVTAPLTSAPLTAVPPASASTSSPTNAPASAPASPAAK